MIQPVSPGFNNPIASSQIPSPLELSEIQYELGVLRAYVSLTGQNGNIQAKISKLENDIKSGKSLEQLTEDVNSLVSQINSGIDPNGVLFPQFNPKNSASIAVAFFCTSLKEVLETAVRTGKIKCGNEESIFDQLSLLITHLRGMSLQQAFQTLNGIIGDTNDLFARNALSGQQPICIPTIPYQI